MTALCHGYEIVCPDGNVRRYPYHNQGDAESDARYVTRKGCARMGGVFKKASPLEEALPPCTGGEHVVRPIAFTHPEHETDGEA